MHESPVMFGNLLRRWRRRRSLSQLGLAVEADISQRHLSFIESGRSTPSREMVMRLAEHLAIPLRERNALLAAAGFAPLYRERRPDDPDFAEVLKSLEMILKGLEPFPALAVDRHWNLVLANGAVAPLLEGIVPSLLKAPVNVLHLSLRPDGLAPRIENFREWRSHILARLAQQIDHSADGALIALQEELKNYPVPPDTTPHRPAGTTCPSGIAIPLRLRRGTQILSFISTTTVFGTALDITLSELAIESFLPADEPTAETLLRNYDSAAGTKVMAGQSGNRSLAGTLADSDVGRRQR